MYKEGLEEKPALYLLPVYIGSLKYYEKLLPRLSQQFAVRFLVVRGADARRQGMLSYCAARGLPVVCINDGLDPARSLRIPFITALLKRCAHQRACRTFIRAAGTNAKVVAVKAIAGFEPLFREANLQGVETIVLQSALTPPAGFYASSLQKARPRFLVALYCTLLKGVFFVSDLVTRGPAYLREPSSPKKVGVIGREGVDIFHDRFGFAKERITVVGTAEFERVSELSRRTQSDRVFREGLLGRYGLDTRKNILVLSSWYEHYVAVKTEHSPEDVETQIRYFSKVMETIRKVFPVHEANILFKLHPAEDDIYPPLDRFGIHRFGDAALPEELLVLSDLYIADPCTSANYMVVASGVPALFINMTPLTALNKCTLFFPITRIVSNWGEFETCLQQAREGNLPPGYDASSVDRNSIERIVSFIAA